MRTTQVGLLTALLLVFVLSLTASADAQDTLRIYDVIGGGQSDAAGGEFRVAATLGQTFSGTYALDSGTVTLGFWQNYGPAACCERRGDLNNSGAVDVSDCTILVDFLFRQGSPSACGEAMDINSSGLVNISDLTFLIEYLFRGGDLPLPC